MKLKFYSRIFVLQSVLYFFVFFLSSILLLAQEPKKKEDSKKKFRLKPDIQLEFELRTTYDDNILKYSEKYLDRFINREDAGRFHINTYDDIISRPSFKINATQKVFKKLSTSVQFNANRSIYLNNSIKSWSYFAFSIEQYFHKKGFVNFSYNYIPNFYIRHYRDDDYVAFLGYVPETFKPMAFSKANWDIFTQYTFFKNTGVRLSLDYTRYLYNQHYIEYDSHDFAYEIRLLQPVHKKVRLQGAYTFTKSFAKGFDQNGETRETSDDADASFFDNNFAINCRWALPSYFNLSHSLTFDGSVGKKTFTSEKYVELDPLHTGRIDYNYRLGITYRFRLNKMLNATLFYNYLGRKTTSRSDINKEFVAIEKDYNQNQVGFSLIYNYKINYGHIKKK